MDAVLPDVLAGEEPLLKGGSWRMRRTVTVVALVALVLAGLPARGIFAMSKHDTFLEAAKRGQANRVGLMIDRGMNVDTKTDGGVTALMVAASNGQVKVVKLLIERGADVNVMNKRGVTPLMAAAMGGSLETVKVLLARNADPNAKDNEGDSVLIWSTRGGNKEVTELLKKRGAK